MSKCLDHTTDLDNQSFQIKGEIRITTSHFFSTDSPTEQFLVWCLEELHEKYKTKSKVKITPWNSEGTVDIDEIYIQLSMLRDHKRTDGKTKKRLQDYAEMFKGYGGDPNRSKRILVYGRPGIGKSTFTQKIAVDWARGKKEILKKFDVLLLINLRDVCDIQDFCTMVETAELLSADEPGVVSTLYEYIRQNQEKVLLVLDGYDEYSAGKSSPVYEIWRGKILRRCCVVITTRPVKEEELSNLSHAQFELNGFDSEEQVKEFASKFLNDQKDVEELVEYLRKYNIWDMAEIPLLLLMLCLLWKDKDRKGLPTSRADLFNRFMQALLDHLVSKDSAQAQPSIDEYREELSTLGELAFYALLEDLLYFNLNKVGEGVDLKKFIVTGFLQPSKLLSSSPEEIVHFLHKSVQEFLAAKFIVDELTRKGKETCTGLSNVNSLVTMEKMVEVLKFVCESSSDAARAVFKHLQWIGEEEGLTAYTFSESPRPEDFSIEQEKFISICTDCLFCCAASDRQDFLPLLLECVDYVLILKTEQVSIAASVHLFHLSTKCLPEYVFFVNEDLEKIDDKIFSVMCDLNTAVLSCSGEVRIENKYASLIVKDVFLKKEGEQMLLCLNRIHKDRFNALPTELLTELASAPESRPRKSVDDLSKNQDNILHQTGQHPLSFVGRITMKLATSEDITVVNSVLPFITRPKIIKIIGNSSTSTLCEAGVISNIHFTDCLHSLKLSGISLTAKCATEIAESLHRAPNLHKLDLSDNPLYSSVSDLARNLHHVPELTELELGMVQMGVKECVVLASTLNNVSKLRVLEIPGNPIGHGIMALAEHLSSLPELIALNLDATEMKGKEATAIARCLPSLSQLQMIDLSGNKLGHGITELAKHLKCLTGLTELELDNTEMGEEETTSVAGCLPSLSHLKKLELSRNPLGRGIAELAKRLKCVPNLTDLLLCDTRMGKEQVSALARALNHVPKLRKLDLSHNPLGRGVRVLIQHLSSVPELRRLVLLGVKMTKAEAEDLGAIRAAVISDYHVSVLFLLIFVSAH